MFKVQFCGIKYIQLVVQASQPSISTNFLSPPTESLYPLNTDFQLLPLTFYWYFLFPWILLLQKCHTKVILQCLSFCNGLMPCLYCAVPSCSVTSDSLWRMGCSPPSSSVLGDSPGKNTGVGWCPHPGVIPCLVLLDYLD